MMYELTRLDDNPKQTIYWYTDTPNRVKLYFYYVPSQESWFFDIEQEDTGFALNGTRLVVHPNILYQYKNLIDFGMAINSEDGYDPLYRDDFSSGRIHVYMVNKNDSDFDYLNGLVDGG